MTRALAERLAKAEASLARGPGGVLCFPRTALADVLRSLDRPADDAAVDEAQAELPDDGPLRRAWLAAGHEIAATMMFLSDDDWRL